MEKDVYQIKRDPSIPWWNIIECGYHLYRNGYILWVYYTLRGAKRAIRKDKRKRNAEYNTEYNNDVLVYEE